MHLSCVFMATVLITTAQTLVNNLSNPETIVAVVQLL